MAAPVHLLKIGDFAKRAGTNLRTLRYYEELGLLRPAVRSEGGFRYYRPTDLNRVGMIRNLQDLGLGLDRIRELLDTRDGGGDRKTWVRSIEGALEEQQGVIEERVAALEIQREHIRQALTKLDLCRDCEHQPGPENNFCEPCARTGDALPAFLSALF